MTYDDCEAFEAQQASERAGRLYARLRGLYAELSNVPGDERGPLEARLDTVALKLARLEDGEAVLSAPLVRELGEIRRALEGTGDMNPGACAECGHLHYLGPSCGYCDCPIDGCGCEGQDWAKV